jgi:hypothetical protein
MEFVLAFLRPLDELAPKSGKRGRVAILEAILGTD